MNINMTDSNYSLTYSSTVIDGHDISLKNANHFFSKEKIILKVPFNNTIKKYPISLLFFHCHFMLSTPDVVLSILETNTNA